MRAIKACERHWPPSQTWREKKRDLCDRAGDLHHGEPEAVVCNVCPIDNILPKKSHCLWFLPATACHTKVNVDVVIEHTWSAFLKTMQMLTKFDCCWRLQMFFIYDRLAERRQNIALGTAKKTTAIASQLFPAQIKERLTEQVQGSDGAKKLSSGMDDIGGKPLADLFLETTVVFADIAGFAAWSSTREPSQVFTLLETLHQSFDKIAKRSRICKVETVGDCCAAACGLPEARADHAPATCRFAADILSRFRVLSKELEVELGPGTGKLGVRVGLHSGQATAGVLRGERARFQLFGDTSKGFTSLQLHHPAHQNLS